MPRDVIRGPLDVWKVCIKTYYLFIFTIEELIKSVSEDYLMGEIGGLLHLEEVGSSVPMQVSYDSW
jgi:hypothetical protein